MSDDYIIKLNELKINNKKKLEELVNKIKRCETLENKVNQDIKLTFEINEKLSKIQTQAEDLFFDICKNINITA